MDNSVNFEILLDDKTRAGMESASGNIDTLSSRIVIQKETIQALEAEIAKLHVQMAESSKVGIVDDAKIAEVEAMRTKIKELSITIQQYEAQANKPAQNTIPAIDATRKKFDGLQWQVNQFARELPALAMGPQMFFLAISNNLPMLTDEIKKAKIEYNDLLAQGGKGTPVWKQMLSSILSWQTALVVGITLLVTYGKEIGEFISGLFGVKKAMDETIESTKGFQQKVSEGMGKNIATINGLSTAWGELGDNLDAKKKFIDENKSSFDSLGVSVDNVNDAEKLLVSNKDTFIESILLRAKAAAAMELASEQYKKGVEKMLEADAMPQTKKVATYSKGSYTGDVEVENRDVVMKRFDAEKIFKQGDDLITKYSGYSEEQKKKIESINLSAQDAITVGSVEAIEKSIATKRQALSKLTNKADYDKAMIDIKVEQAKLNAIIGNGGEKGDQKPINDINDYKIEAQRKVEENVIALMEDGAKRQKAILKQKYDDEMAAIDKKEKALLDSYARLKKSGVDVDDKDVKQTKEFYDTARTQAGNKLKKSTTEIDSNAENTKAKKEKKELDAVLLEFETYSQKRVRVAAEYDDKIALLTKNGETERAIEAEDKKQNALNGIDEEFAQKQNAYNTWADSVANLSIAKLDELLVKAKEELQKLEDGGVGGDKTATARAKVTKLQSTITKQKTKQDTQKELSPTKRSLKDWADLQDVLQDVSKEFDEIGEMVGGVAGDIIKSAGQITSSSLSMISGILTLANWSIKATEMTAQGTAKSIQTVEKASVILTIVSAALQVVTQLMNFFGKQETLSQATIDNYDSLMSVTDELIDKQKELLETMAGNEAIMASKKTLAIIEEQVQATKNIGKAYLNTGQSMGSHSYGVRLKKNLQQYKGVLNSIGVDIDSMGGRMEGIFDLSAEKLQEIKEKSYGAWVAMGSDVTDYLQTIIDGNEKVKEIGDLLSESLTGLTLDDAKDALSDFLNDADATFEDVANSFEDNMKNAVNKIIATSLNKDLMKWYENFEKAMSDEQLDESERNRLQKEYEDIYKDAINKRNEAYKIAGIVSDVNNVSQSASEGAFTTMSQDQAGKLEGLFTASEMRIASIDATTKEVRQSLDSVNETLVKIEENTSTTNDKLDEVKEVLDDIKKNGLIMK